MNKSGVTCWVSCPTCGRSTAIFTANGWCGFCKHGVWPDAQCFDDWHTAERVAAPPEPATKLQDLVGTLDSVSIIRKLRELNEKVSTLEQALRTIKELGRVTMATEVGREIILAAIDEALSGESRQ